MEDIHIRWQVLFVAPATRSFEYLEIIDLRRKRQTRKDITKSKTTAPITLPMSTPVGTFTEFDDSAVVVVTVTMEPEEVATYPS